VPSFEEIPYDYSSQLDYSPTGGGTAPNVYKGDTSYGSGETTAFPDAATVTESPSSFVPSGTAFPQYRSQPEVTADAPAVAAPVGAEGRVPYFPTPRETGNYPGGSVLTGAKNVGEEPGFFGSMKDETKARLGIGGAQSLIGAYQVSQATEQAKKYREDMAKLAQPYQTEGKKLIAQAQSGELTPAAQQQLQAAQAQAAQGAEKRGGVGAQQAQMAVENMRQQLLQNQYDYGLKITGIGDSIATGAIRTGMDADRYVNQLASNYANNIARTLSNAPTYVTSYSQNT
jgi:hypothetical protein